MDSLRNRGGKVVGEVNYLERREKRTEAMAMRMKGRG